MLDHSSFYFNIVFQFLVLDEADRVLDAGFEEELRVVFKCLPKNRLYCKFNHAGADSNITYSTVYNNTPA